MQKILFGLIFISLSLFSSEKSITFEKIFGGTDDDKAKAVISTGDGYLIVGKTKSFTKNRDFNAYLIKIDKNGKKLWSKSYGGEEDENANDITQIGEDFVFIGSTETYCYRTRPHIYVVKIDGDGNIYWRKSCYGYSDDDFYGKAIAADDNKLVIANTQKHIQFFTAQTNPYILKMDAQGDKIWRGYYGGKDEDTVNAIINTPDGYLMAGKTESYGNGDFDSYIVKLNKSGKKLWHKTYGGKDDDEASDIISTKDGFLIVGTTSSFDLDFKNVYIIKIDKKGEKIWQRAYGGELDDEGFAITQSPDGGYVVVGKTNSFARGNGYDLYLFKIDNNGKVQWTRTYGGQRDDAGYDIITAEDGYLIVGEKQTYKKRDSDVWVLKVDFEGRRGD